MARKLCDADDAGVEAGAPASVPQWRVSAAYGWLSSELRFGDVYAPFDQQSVAVSATRRLGNAWTISAGAGAIVAGKLSVAGADWVMDPGWLVRFGATWLPIDGSGPWPFLALSGSLAASGVNTTGPDGQRAPLTAVDAGLSVSAGKSIAGVVAPYVGAKVFGGPVFWTVNGAASTGTDVSHWQVAFGLSANLPLGLDLLVEWAPFGARSAVGQLGWTF